MKIVLTTIMFSFLMNGCSEIEEVRKKMMQITESKAAITKNFCKISMLNIQIISTSISNWAMFTSLRRITANLIAILRHLWRMQ